MLLPYICAANQVKQVLLEGNSWEAVGGGGGGGEGVGRDTMPSLFTVGVSWKPQELGTTVEICLGLNHIRL